MAKSILDFMSEDDRKKAIERGRRRMEKQRSKKGLDVSPEIFIIAEFGYYFGWDGIMAIKQGFIEKVDEKGEVVRDPFTLTEALVLLEGARKVWYSKLIEQSHGNMIASASKFSKTPAQSFNNGMKPFTDRTELKE